MSVPFIPAVDAWQARPGNLVVFCLDNGDRRGFTGASLVAVHLDIGADRLTIQYDDCEIEIEGAAVEEFFEVFSLGQGLVVHADEVSIDSISYHACHCDERDDEESGEAWKREDRS